MMKGSTTWTSSTSAPETESSSESCLHQTTQCALCSRWYSAVGQTQLRKYHKTYWSCRDEIGICDGVIFKGRQVVLPVGLRRDILQQLHEGHLEIEKTRRLMRESVYWPNIHRDIAKMVKSCAACQENQTEHRQQPLVAHDVPSTRWTKVASDMFESKGDNYLIITDYQSKFHVVQKTTSTTSNTIAHRRPSGSASWDHRWK